MSLTWPNKDGDEVLDYEIDWSALLDTDTIATSAWVVSGGDVVIDSSSNTTTTTKVWLSGGTNGTAASLVNTIVTAGGRTFEQGVKMKIKAR